MPGRLPGPELPARAVRARLIMGCPFEGSNRVLARAEVRAMLRNIGRNRVEAFARIAPALEALPLARPTIGAGSWMADLGSFLDREPGIRVVTLHRYPLQNCRSDRTRPTIRPSPTCLSQTASQGLAVSLATTPGRWTPADPDHRS